MKIRIVALGLLFGCLESPRPDVTADGIDPRSPDEEVGVLHAPPGDELQGRRLLGNRADGLLSGGSYFRVGRTATAPDGNTYTLAVTAAGNLGGNGANLIADDGTAVHVGADPWFADLVLSQVGAGTGQIRIDEVKAPITGTSATYLLSYRASAADAWRPFCEGGAGAIALHGWFDAQRVHQVGNSITFACPDGVAYKCNSWGYVAGIAGPGNANWDHHQACIQMANAAYCGGAESYTREQTPILITDFVKGYGKPESIPPHPAPLPGDPDTYYFEAAWRAGGQAPICLSKLRWQSLPPDPCGPALPDPRYSDADNAKYCEELTVGFLRANGAVLINASMLMDAPLERWSNMAGDAVSTIRGFVDLNAGQPADLTAPFTDYDQYLVRDGMILRNLPGTLDANQDMIRLYIHHTPDGTKHVLSDGNAIPGYQYDPAVDFEGYAFKDPHRVPNLTRLYVCPTISGLRTTTTPCTNPISSPGLMYVLPAP